MLDGAHHQAFYLLAIASALLHAFGGGKAAHFRFDTCSAVPRSFQIMSVSIMPFGEATHAALDSVLAALCWELSDHWPPSILLWLAGLGKQVAAGTRAAAC